MCLIWIKIKNVYISATIDNLNHITILAAINVRFERRFRIFAEKYNISFDTVHGRYYSKRVKNGRVKDKYPIFGVFGRYRGIANTKVYSRESSKGYNFWSIIKKIFN